MQATELREGFSIGYNYCEAGSDEITVKNGKLLLINSDKHGETEEREIIDGNTAQHALGDLRRLKAATDRKIEVIQKDIADLENQNAKCLSVISDIEERVVKRVIRPTPSARFGPFS
jgi:hypothetical protein